MRKLTFFCLLTAFLACPMASYASEQFWASAQMSGQATVKLYPTEDVPTGTPVLVTFGFPFTRGSVTQADLAKVRVLENAAETPAHVDQLTPWRHFTDPAIDSQSVRVARIQIHHVFQSAFPGYDSVEVQWGGPDRVLDVPALENPRSAWHLVASGTFAPQDSVYEPDVYAVLPKELLSQGILKPPRMEPFADDISPLRDDPYMMDTILHWPGNREQMLAQKNFFYTIVNQDDPLVAPANLCPYKTDYEPWLFDRSASIYVLYLRSGFFTALREGVRSAVFYARHLQPTGYFDLNPSNDSKYSYNECLAYTHWLTGDDVIREKISWPQRAFNDYTSRWSPSLGFWTERHTGMKLHDYIVAYEVLGENSFKDSACSITDDLVWHQNGAGGLLNPGPMDGGLFHYGHQHAWDWDPDSIGASGWMNMFIIDPMLRVYSCGGGAQVADYVRRTGNFFTKIAFTTTYTNDEGLHMRYPRYAILMNGTDSTCDGYEWSDEYHSMEVAAGTAYASYFAEITGQPDTLLRSIAGQYYYTYDDFTNFWTRPAGPQSGLAAYRVTPFRKYNWEYRPSGGYSWAMAQEGPAGIASPSGASRPLTAIRLLPCSPNPAGRMSTLRFQLASRGRVRLTVYNALGQAVRVLVDGHCEAGTHAVGWDLRNQQGSQVATGIYMCEVRSGGLGAVRKMTVVR